ncbi:zinc transporter ZIP13-like [Haliotis rubra]|uniref:zinc transporter ZIP13-like n=1 Tax=Haliotis rubra TaxID=36100 RepID=UPI001EE5CD95|nr:zinc transporter ZIP13-like [Haliotis rubra]
MACYQHLVYVMIVIYAIYSAYTTAEIHRAKPAVLKNGVKSKRPPDVALDPERLDMIDEESHRTYEIWTYSVLSSVLVGLSGIFPLLVIPLESGSALRHGAAASRLKLMLSFAVGGLLGDVFLHLLPEAWAYLDKDDLHNSHSRIGLWIINGLLLFLILEKTFGDENEFTPIKDTCEEEPRPVSAPVKQESENSHKKRRHKNNKKTSEAVNNKKVVNRDSLANTQQKNTPESSSGKEHIKVSGYLNLMANCIDNFTHGLAVAGSFIVSTKVGFMTTIAILLHEIPHEIGDFAILLRSGFDRWKAAKAQLLTATGGVIGALTALLSDSAQAAGERTAWILPFTSGGFLYIALVTVVPDLLQEKHGWESVKQVLCLIGGVATMCIVTLVC